MAAGRVEADGFDEWATLAERLYAPDAVWHLGGMLGSLQGFAAIRAFVMGYWSMWEEHHHRVWESVDLGDGVWYMVTRERATGAHPAADTRLALTCMTRA